MNILFKNIRTVNPSQKLDETNNLWIKDGEIIHCNKELPSVDPNTEIIDGEKLVAAPGFFDMHVHFRDPGDEAEEDLQTGTAAAANGGFTGVVCMPNTTPCIDSPAVLDEIIIKSKGNLVDVKVAAAITRERAGVQLTDMFELNDSGAVFFTDDGNSIENTEVLRRAFDYASTKDLLIAEHCEDKTLTDGFSVNECMLASKMGLKGYPSIAESNIVYRDIETARYIGNSRFHVMHISTKKSIELVRLAKAQGDRVTAEVAPHHFSFDDSEIASYNTDFKMNPPLRSKEDIEAILKGLQDGTIDCIATDHAPHTLNEKEVEFEHAPNGIVGLETAVGAALTHLVNTNVIDINTLVEKMSINPRKICRLDPIEIKVGEKANITVLNPTEEWTVDKNKFLSKSKNSPFDGLKLTGKPKFVFNNGKAHKCIL